MGRDARPTARIVGPSVRQAGIREIGEKDAGTTATAMRPIRTPVRRGPALGPRDETGSTGPTDGDVVSGP